MKMMKTIVVAYILMNGCFNDYSDVVPVRYDSVLCEVKSIEHEVYKVCENVDNTEDIIRMEIEEIKIGDMLEVTFNGERIDRIERIGTDGNETILE